MKNPSKFCMCGCGAFAPPSPVSRRGYKRGEPLRFIKGHSSRKPVDFDIDENGCWNWKRPLNSYGYGRITKNGKTMGAHCYFYILRVGNIPEGCELHHTCENPKCCNPSHLIPVTRREHMATDGRAPFGNEHAKVKP